MLPTVPTDNLFKFLAVGGLLMAGFSVWASKELADRLKAEEAIARDQYVEFMAEMEANMNEIASRLKTKKEIRVQLAVPDWTGKLDRMKPGSQYQIAVEPQYRDHYRNIIVFWDNWLASCLPHNGQEPNEATAVFTEDVVKALRAKLRTHSLTVENLWREVDKTEYYLNLAWWGTLVGLMASFTGFFFWFRGQRRQDALEKTKLEQEQKSPESPGQPGNE